MRVPSGPTPPTPPLPALFSQDDAIDMRAYRIQPCKNCSWTGKGHGALHPSISRPVFFRGDYPRLTFPPWPYYGGPFFLRGGVH